MDENKIISCYHLRMFGFFKDKFNNLRETVSNTAQALVNNVVNSVENEE